MLIKRNLLRKLLIIAFINILLSSIHLTTGAKAKATCSIAGGSIAEETIGPGLICTGYTEIPTDIPNPSQLRQLSMHEKNNLENITSGELLRSKLTNLNALHLTNCQIKRIERGAFFGGDRLTELSLTDNQITTLDPYVFSDLPNLEKLFLSSNSLHQFASFMEFPPLKLKWLSLSNSEIASINPYLLRNLKELEELHLDNNKLSSIQIETFKDKVRKLKWVSLYGNRWNCDCKFSFLMKYFKKSRISLYSPKNTTCASAANPKLIGMSWTKLKIQKPLTCRPLVSNFIQVNTGRYSNGGEIQLICEFSGYPKPEITFLEGDKPMKVYNDNKTPSKKNAEFEAEGVDDFVRTEPDDGNNEYRDVFAKHMLIKPVGFPEGAEELGTFTCLATNPAGNSTKNISLRFGKHGVVPYDTMGVLTPPPPHSNNGCAGESASANVQTSSYGVATWVVVVQSFVIFILAGLLAVGVIYFRMDLKMLFERWLVRRLR